MFRLVGYGQRPGPAIASWFVFALLAALGSLIWPLPEWPSASASVADVLGDIGEKFMLMLLSPFFLLRLAGDPQLASVTSAADLAPLLLRTVVATPFVFAVFAVGRFLRAEWPLPNR